ncbi:MAG: DUF2971 domain-containing protein [Nitrospina sp.]|nr:MAG: DUF2971 domain-containing protein [Nitrospina sp.]
MPEKEVWETYPEIYHYTRFSSALLIIQSATLRATRYDLLDDTQEINYSKDIIAQKLLEKFPGATIEDAKAELENIFFKAMGNTIYITSFCGKNLDADHYHHDHGRSNMWKSYGTDESGSGCAIIFKTKNIFDRTKQYKDLLNMLPALIMDEVIYKGHNNDKPDYCKRLNRFVENASNFINNCNDRNSYSMDNLCTDQLYLMLLTKQPAFFEEREVRRGLCFKTNLQENPNPLNPPPKYYSIPFSPDEDISGIIIGPHRKQQERYKFLTSYLSKFSLENIIVTKSEIPVKD